MRPAVEYFLSDRQNDSTDTQQKLEQEKSPTPFRDHHQQGQEQELELEQEQEQEQEKEQDAAVHLPGSSTAATIATPRYVTTCDDEDPEYLPDSCPVDSSGLADFDRPIHSDSRQPAEYDLDMSDSDGGAPLDRSANSNELLLSDMDYDTDETYQMDEEEEEEEGEEEGEVEEYDPSNPIFFPTSMDAIALGSDVNPYIGVPGTMSPQDPWDYLTPSSLADLTPSSATPVFLSPTPQTPDNIIDMLPPVPLGNPNPSILGSENLGLVEFLRSWAYGQILYPNIRVTYPDLHDVLRQAGDSIEQVEYSQLLGDGCDFQGLDWESMGTTRKSARERRLWTYKNYVNKKDSDKWSSSTGERALPAKDDFFRFKRMDIRRDVALAHFQLRSVLACPSRIQAFYPSLQGINVLNTASKKTEVAMDLRQFPGMSSPAISTLDAACGVLLGGTFSGDYYLQSLHAQDGRSYSEGQISTDISGITNHIRIYQPRRSHSPVAAIASNDHVLRIMDLQTERFTSKTTYPFALNCSAVSPDGRLRALVGDNLDVFITNADTGETLQKLSGHRDFGFACDWSDDGHTVASGFQDKGIRIWDARRWCNSSGVSEPLCTIRAEMAGVRGLRFSPVGSGKPVLVAAEEADFINMIDAQTFASKQTFDVFGEIGGIAFTNGGQDLNVLCCDTQRGGLLQLERCGSMGEPFWQRGTSQDLSSPRPWGRRRRRGDWEEVEEAERTRVPTFWGGPEPF